MRKWIQMWMWIALTLTGVLSGCGKSQDFYSVPTYSGPPYSQGPVTPSYTQGPYVPPAGINPPISSQIPSGYPQSYQPFAPLYNYFQQSQALRQYYANLWYRWQLYAAVQRINIYNFQSFWYDFCPQQIPSQFYIWFEESVYEPSGYGYCSACF